MATHTGDGTLELASKAAPCTCTAAQIEHRSEHSHGKRTVGTDQGGVGVRLSFSRLTTHRARWGGTPRHVITSLSVREQLGTSTTIEIPLGCHDAGSEQAGETTWSHMILGGDRHIKTHRQIVLVMYHVSRITYHVSLLPSNIHVP
jgi:hypothetical protein